MIISRTPFRISFSGGGSDIKEYYSKYSGAVLSTTIDKYVYLSMHPFFHENKYFLKYSRSELVENIDDVQHPIIREVFRDFNIQGVDFNSSADIPAGTGMASSSAFTSGLINLCSAYSNKFLTKEKIAEYACNMEIKRLKEPIGKQDQYACAIGGVNFIIFNEDDTVVVEKINLSNDLKNRLDNNLLLFYLGGTRKTSSILNQQRKNISNDKKKIEILRDMVGLTYDLKKEIQSGNICSFGDILHEGWIRKKELAVNISNSLIDNYYKKAINNGASGGKLLGAGGSGFLLFYAELENHGKLRNALKDLEELKFNFDNSGTTIIY